MSAGVENILRKLIESKFDEEEFSDFFLIELKISPNNKIQVFIESDTHVNFDHCRKMSRYLEAFIDEEGWFGEQYTLEVSSPGVDRPLTMIRQYLKNIGRKVKVTPKEGKVVKGELSKANEDGFTVSFTEKVKVGKKKKKKEIRNVDFSYDEVAETLVKVTF